MTRAIIIIATTIADVTTAPMITLELPDEHRVICHKYVKLKFYCNYKVIK